MEELKTRFPAGRGLRASSTTPRRSSANRSRGRSHVCSMRSSWSAIVVLVFLQNWRSTIIPLVAVPVSLIGTFAVMAMLGFTPEQYLAVRPGAGDRHRGRRRDRGGRERRTLDRARPVAQRGGVSRAMEEVTVAVIAIAFGLSAVFIPTAFISGITGQFYRQFALTIATSTLISAFNSLTLSPALAAILLKPHGAKKDCLTATARFPLRLVLQAASTRSSTATTDDVRPRRCAGACALAAIGMLVYVGLLGLTYFGFTSVPAGFIPTQDKGYLLVNVQLPDSASLQRTQEAMVAQMRRSPCKTKGVGAHRRRSPASRSCSTPTARTRHRCSSSSTRLTTARSRNSTPTRSCASCMRRCLTRRLRRRQVAVFGAPPVDGMGNAGGFKLMVEDRGNNGLRRSAGADRQSGRKGQAASPDSSDLFSQFRASMPQLYVDIDRMKCKTHGRALSDVFNTLAGLSGRILRQRLQPIRPHLAGESPGRSQFPHAIPSRSHE